jgi:hypothetical protein
MGCLSPPLPPEVKELLKEVTKRGDEIANKFLIEANQKQREKVEVIEERHEKVKEADKKDTESLNKLLLEYNKKEIEKDKELIENEVEKLHCIYEMGLDLSDKLKEITLDQLKKKLDKAPELAKRAINSQIEQVKKYSAKEFLNSEFGKPLKTALEKQGLRDKYLKDYIQNLEKERKERRAEERKEFGISKNEFPPEDDLNFTAEDLFEAIFDEYKNDDDFKNKIKKIILKSVLK